MLISLPTETKSTHNMNLLKKKWLAAILCLIVTAITHPSFGQVADPEQADTTQSTIAKMYNDLETIKKLKITGYVQAQFQYADSSGSPAAYAGGNFAPGDDKRFMVRRGRLKATWTNTNSQYVLQVDANEGGAVVLKDAYFKFTDPYLQMFTLTGGVFNRPFGYEITFSSSDRESPERGRMSQIIFPNERDMGFMLTIQAPKTSRWNCLKLDAGFFNGTGLNAKEFDKKKDFIGHLTYNAATRDEKIKYGVGVSLYDGGFAMPNDTLYKMSTVTDTAKFTYSNDHNRVYSTRMYYGGDAQISIDWLPGITTFRAEYITGVQPASSTTTTSVSVMPTTSVFTRKFNGAYFYFLQNVGQTKLQLVAKYDWYDPNTDVKGTEVGMTTKISQTGVATNVNDIKFSTLGLGAIWRFDQNMKIVAYYDMVKNEKTSVKGYYTDIKDNVVTIRLQYRF